MSTIAALALASLLHGQELDGAKILSAVNSRLETAQTLSGSADVAFGMGSTKEKISLNFKYKKPNMGELRIVSGPPAMPKTRMLSNGQSSWAIDEEKKSYIKMAGQPASAPPGMEAMVGQKSSYKVTSAKAEALDGVNCVRLELATEAVSLKRTLWVDPAANVILKVSEGENQTIVYSGLRFDEPMADALFTFTPGKDYKEQETGGDSFEAKLLKVGSKAPNWTLKMPNGKMMSLAQALKGKKALVLNFWFYG